MIVTSFERAGFRRGREEGVDEGKIRGLKEGLMDGAIEGLKRGQMEGMKEARVEVLRECVLRILDIRFGRGRSSDVENYVEGLTEPEVLLSLHHEAVVAEELTEFRRKLLALQLKG